MSKKHPYRCLWCGRVLGAPVGHRCKGVMRYRHLRFRMDDGTVWERGLHRVNQATVKFERNSGGIDG